MPCPLPSAPQALGVERETYIEDDMWRLHQEAKGLADDTDAPGLHAEAAVCGDEHHDGSTGDEGLEPEGSDRDEHP